MLSVTNISQHAVHFTHKIYHIEFAMTVNVTGNAHTLNSNSRNFETARG